MICFLKKTTKEQRKNSNVSVGRGRFIKKTKDDMYAQCW